MRARCIPPLAVLLFSVVDVLGCGLASDGTLVGDGSGANTLTAAFGRDAAMGSAPGEHADAPADPTTGDDAGAFDDGTSGDAAAADEVGSSDAASVVPPDGSLPPPDDSGLPKEGGGGPLTCHQCVAQKCPPLLAACGPGSACIGYRDCNLMCGGSGNTCSKACASKYPGGDSAFTALTLCAIPCGGACLVQLSFGTP